MGKKGDLSDFECGMVVVPDGLVKHVVSSLPHDCVV